MWSPTHREIDAPPYRLVINVQPKYRTRSPDEIEGYVARGIVTKLDGTAVYERYLEYQIFDGETFVDLESAIRDGEQRARDAIHTGFPR
jgi:hypothetical protein